MTSAKQLTRLFALLAALALVATSLTGCVIETDPSDLILIDDPIYVTAGEVVFDLAESLCNQLADCDEINSFDFAECVDIVFVDVCAELNCDAAPRGSDAEILDCLDAIDSQACVDSDELAFECGGLL